MGSRKRTSLDKATIFGLVLAVASIVGGLILEKGNIRDIAQLTAGLIVFGGTLGAVLVTTPMAVFRAALAHLKTVFFETEFDTQAQINEIIIFATKARSSGIISLESDANTLRDPFLKKAMNLAVDGGSSDQVSSTMEVDIDQAEHRADESAKVYEQAGGYAPTVGIIGAVLGLIQVMKNLANIEEVGHGIAVAFVATVYGVALANLFLLPAASKIRLRAARERQAKELWLLGVLGILEGSNPKMLNNKLNAFLVGGEATAKKTGKASQLRRAA